MPYSSQVLRLRRSITKKRKTMSTYLLFVTVAWLLTVRGTFGCFSSTLDILDHFATLPNPSPGNVTTVELCSNVIFPIGNQTNDVWLDGQPPLMARSHTHFKCGSDGSSSRSCILLGGQIQFWSPRTDGDQAVENVVVQGVTFQSADDVAILMENSGDISFVDCIVQVCDRWICRD